MTLLQTSSSCILWAYPPATMCDHDFAKDDVLLRLTIGSPWRDSGFTSPVSRDCVRGASPCEVVFWGPGIVDLAGKAEAMALQGPFLEEEYGFVREPGVAKLVCGSVMGSR